MNCTEVFQQIIFWYRFYHTLWTAQPKKIISEILILSTKSLLEEGILLGPKLFQTELKAIKYSRKPKILFYIFMSYKKLVVFVVLIFLSNSWKKKSILNEKKKKQPTKQEVLFIKLYNCNPKLIQKYENIYETIPPWEDGLFIC